MNRPPLSRWVAWIGCVVAGWSFSAAPTAQSAAPSSYDLYVEGKAVEALARAQAELRVVMETGTLSQRWEHAMFVAWLAESMGSHQAALRYARTALDIASELDSSFKIGRSLCWLGWSATSLGLYPLALEFYDAAIEQATDSEGRTREPMVWGLATQEKGSVLAKMGELVAGAELIETTTEYAREHGIRVGVAEGGAHLARIALQRGNWAEARARAEEAVIAAEDCNCSAYNTNRARLTLARVMLERSRVDPKYRPEAEARIRDALEAAEKVSDRRHMAEAQLLLSRAIDAAELQQRIELVNAAAESLHGIGSELRGIADGALGALMLEADRAPMAGVYLQSGLEINEELLRKLDAAYILGDLAEIDLLSNDPSAHLEKWMDSAERAESSGAWPLAAESQERVSEEFLRLGLMSLSRHWGQKALETIGRLLEIAEDPERRVELEWRMLALRERVVEIDIELDHSPAPLHGDVNPASALQN